MCRASLLTNYDVIFHDHPSSSVVVLGCLVASIILDTNEGPTVNDQYWVNTMRDAFKCNPRFSGSFASINIHEMMVDVWVDRLHSSSINVLCFCLFVDFALDVIFIHGQFIVCGTLTVACVISIVRTIATLEKNSGLSKKEESPKISFGSLFRKGKIKETTVVEKGRRDRSRRIAGLGLACAVLLVFNVVLPPALQALHLKK
jgi:hypothetical protein